MIIWLGFHIEIIQNNCYSSTGTMQGEGMLFISANFSSNFTSAFDLVSFFSFFFFVLLSV